MTSIQQKLFDLCDPTYRAFSSKLMPTVDPSTVIGVRIPALRRLARRLVQTDEARFFLRELPHAYYEENNLHAFLIEQIEDFDNCIAEIDAFLPYVDNWATCDSMRPKCFSKNKQKLLPFVFRWLDSAHPYTVRFAIEVLMLYFLEEDCFATRYPDLVSSVSLEDYYVKMMMAWYFATALTKQWDAILPYLTNGCLPLWVHNKTIQKAIESRCFSIEQKNLLRKLKRKK